MSDKFRIAGCEFRVYKFSLSGYCEEAHLLSLRGMK